MKNPACDTFQQYRTLKLKAFSAYLAVTVFGSFPINIGEQVDGASWAEAIKRCSVTGLFTGHPGQLISGGAILTVREASVDQRIKIAANKISKRSIFKERYIGGLARRRPRFSAMQHDLHRLEHGKISLRFVTCGHRVGFRLNVRASYKASDAISTWAHGTRTSHRALISVLDINEGQMFAAIITLQSCRLVPGI